MNWTRHVSCSGSLKKSSFGYQWQAALALVGPMYDTSVESTNFAGTSVLSQGRLVHILQCYLDYGLVVTNKELGALLLRKTLYQVFA